MSCELLPLQVASTAVINDVALLRHFLAEGNHTHLSAELPELHDLARRGDADLIKISSVVLPEISQSYQWLPVGGAFAHGASGPVLIARSGPLPTGPRRLASPGASTTAHHLALRYGATLWSEVTVAPAAKIASEVACGHADLGVLIHQQAPLDPGLRVVLPLGALWEEECGGPLPLGGFVLRKSLGPQVAARCVVALRRSLEHAWQQPASTPVPWLSADSYAPTAAALAALSRLLGAVTS